MKRVGLIDTSPEARRVLDEVYRRMTPARKWALLGDLYGMGRSLHAAGVRLRDPAATPAQIRDDWVAVHYGDVHRTRSTEPTDMEPQAANIRVVHEVLAAFESLGIAYALGGSLASSIHGIMRNTSDADVSVEPFDGLEGRLVASFGNDYYVSLNAIRQALRDRASFNIINTSVGFKVDVFVRKDRPFEHSLMRRRSLAPLGGESGRPIAVVSPEDSILLKLEWYRLGNETSERQWLDVLGVLRVQGDRLDGAYLDRWASALGVADLLDEARCDAAD